MQVFGLSADRFDVLEEAEPNHFWFVARRRLLVGMLRRHLPQKESLLLDLGCGPGHNLPSWRAFAHQVIGVDQHSKAKQKTPAPSQDFKPQIIEGDVTHLPFEAKTADVVLLLDVLEHVDDKAALSEAFRVLKPGGTLLLSVPAHPWLWGARDEGASHLRRYTKRQICGDLAGAGFLVSVVRPYQFMLLPVVMLSRLVGKYSRVTRDMEDQPSPIVNGFLKWINCTEVTVSLAVCAMPTGSSYVVLARKPE